MKATIFVEPGKMEIHEVAKPVIENPTDAIVRVVRASVCGSDLWWYRGISDKLLNTTAGHEAVGVVETVGGEVTAVKPGDFVVVPFTHGCGHCAACSAGFDGNCLNAQAGASTYQAEYLRATNANWALITIPG